LLPGERDRGTQGLQDAGVVVCGEGVQDRFAVREVAVRLLGPAGKLEGEGGCPYRLQPVHDHRHVRLGELAQQSQEGCSSLVAGVP
jgi:hypothetical protein